MSSHLKLPALLLALIAALLLWFPSLAQESNPPEPEPLVLTDETGKIILGKHIDILEDPSGELTINDVTTPEIASSFQRSLADVPIYGYTNSTFWIRMRFRNETSLSQNFLLEANFPNLNYLDLYLPSDEDGYFLKQSGALRPFETRDIPYYHVVFETPTVKPGRTDIFPARPERLIHDPGIHFLAAGNLRGRKNDRNAGERPVLRCFIDHPWLSSFLVFFYKGYHLPVFLFFLDRRNLILFHL